MRDGYCCLLTIPSLLLLLSSGTHVYLHSFPTRRSSDLHARLVDAQRHARWAARGGGPRHPQFTDPRTPRRGGARDQDRKSTRLNSSHLGMSYAVFCLKKKKNKCRIFIMRSW